MRDYSKTRQTRNETKARHAEMDCKVFEIKVIRSKLNKIQKEQINQLFREAKWFKNALITDLEIPTTADTVSVKVGNEFEDKKLEILPGAIKQSLKTEIKTSIKSLSTHKKKGDKIGKLKYKSFCNSVDLKQYGNTYKIVDKNHIRMQNFKKHFNVRGLKQIPENAEIANGKFIRKPDGFYFQITCYLPKTEIIKNNKDTGLDFGIRFNITQDNGFKISADFPESKSIKLISKRLSKCYERNGKKKTNNYKKLKHKRQIAYQKLTNKKKDKANKIVHELLSNNDEIYMQDELLFKWHKDKHSSAKVQHSIMGIVKKKLRKSSKVTMIESSFPSTQVCPNCLNLTKHPVHKRAYDCQFCGYHHDDRDIKAAICIKAYGKIKHLRSADVSLADLRAAGINFLSEDFMLSSGEKSTKVEKKQEAQEL